MSPLTQGVPKPQGGDPRQPGATPRGSVTSSCRSPERAAQVFPLCVPLCRPPPLCGYPSLRFRASARDQLPVLAPQGTEKFFATCDSWFRAVRFLDHEGLEGHELAHAKTQRQWFCPDVEVANFDGGYPGCPGEGAFQWLNRSRTVPVGCFPESEWGLCDMHGQLWEWCEEEDGS